MEYRRFKNVIVLKLNRGEEIVSSVKSVCEREKVTLAKISGIGAAQSVKAGFYDVQTRNYHTKEYRGNLEILSLDGNVTQKDGVYLHLHISFAAEDGTAYGGHLNEAVIGGAGEIFLTVINGKVFREIDDETGLNVFLFPQNGIF